MADFYNVLVNSLRKRDIRDPAARERVYLKARMALIRKLWAQEPRLSDREIEDNVSVFDLAVGLVESDITPTLPSTRRRRREREPAARLFRPQDLPDIRFDLTESDVEAEEDPAESDRLAYRNHIREAAARINQWTDQMVQRIDPLSIAAVAFAHGGGDSAGRGRIAPLVQSVRETVLAEPVINIPAERGARPERTRFLRTFFPQGSRQAGTEAAPGFMDNLLRRIIVSFERLSVRLYEASVLAERERRQKAAIPRVRIRPPSRPGDVEVRHRRLRRRLIGRFLVPAAALVTVSLIVWGSSVYYPAIIGKVEELTADQAPPRDEPEIVIDAKEDDAEAPAAALLEPDITLFDGRDPTLFVSEDGNPVQFDADAEGGHVRVASSPDGASGARLVVAPGLADRLAGRTIHIVVTARSSTTDGAGTVRLAYQAGSESSAFSAQPLGTEYRRLDLVWTVPGGAALGEHALLVEPGLLGGGTAVDIRSVDIYFAP